MTGLDLLRQRYPWPAAMPDVPPDDHGWFSACNARMLGRFLDVSTRLVVELGSWLGLSGRFILQAAPNAVLVCVDHWLGSAEHRQGGACDPAAKLPTLYATFLRNMWPWKERVIPLRANTLAGLAQLHALQLQPDLIYVDASHEYPDVLADLETARALFPQAQLVGDDFAPPWVGVIQAVREVAQRHRLELQTEGHTWALLQPQRSSTGPSAS